MVSYLHTSAKSKLAYIENSNYHAVIPYYVIIESVDSICKDGNSTLISLK